jgi:hypothetical protein
LLSAHLFRLLSNAFVTESAQRPLSTKQTLAAPAHPQARRFVTNAASLFALRNRETSITFLTHVEQTIVAEAEYTGTKIHGV